MGRLPAELLELSITLLAHSRSRISNLKPHEEVARSYACAHIACDRYFSRPNFSVSRFSAEFGCSRLRIALDLPPVTAKPPLPQRAYRSLLAHFQKSLNASTRVDESASANSGHLQAVSLDLRNDIRLICHRLGAANAEVYIQKAMATVISELCVDSSDVYHLLAAIVLMTIERLAPQDGGSVQVGSVQWKRHTGFMEKRKLILNALPKPTFPKSIDTWVQNLTKQGPERWLWIKDTPSGGGLKIIVHDVERNGNRKRAARSGIGRMLQERIDYLTSGRRYSYAEWKGDIVKQLQ